MAIIYSYPRRIPLASDIMLAAEISAPGEDPPVVKSFTVGQLIELIEGGGGIYAPLDSPQFTGTPYLPIGTTGVTRAISNNSTSLATTAFVQSVITAIAPGQQTLQQVTTKGNVTTTSIEANSFVKTGGTGTNILLDDGNIVALSSIGGNTNLSTSQTATNFTINSDTGNDAVVPLGNGIDAGATLNNYTTAEQTKLAGIAPGAQVNVNADWNATGGDAQILNKPTISGTNTGDQNLQTVTNGVGNNITTNPINVQGTPVGSNNIYSEVEQNSTGLYVRLDDSAAKGINILNNDSPGTFPFTYSLDDTEVVTVLTEINNAGELTAQKLIRDGGTSSQILAADGSVITQGNNITITGGVISSAGGTGGGGSSVNYYLNGSISQGTFGGTTYYEFSKTAVIGAGADFSRSSNGLIASFITDVADPSLLLIPAGNWNLEFYFSSSSAGGTPSFYVELYKYDGTTFTSIASNSATPEGITGGTSIDAYFTSLAVPETILTVNDRLAIRVFVNASSKTITLHTQNGHLCEVITTFTSGLTALNGLQAQVQNFSTGTTGTDFAIVSSGSTHTFNLPSASATDRGVVTTGTQTIAGAKTFSSAITFSSISVTSFGTSELVATDNGGLLRSLNTDDGYPNISEIAYVTGVTSPIQTQLNYDAGPTQRGAITTGAQTIAGAKTFSTGIIASYTSADTIASISSTGQLIGLNTSGGNPSITELGYVKNVTSSIQPQIDTAREWALTNANQSFGSVMKGVNMTLPSLMSITASSGLVTNQIMFVAYYLPKAATITGAKWWQTVAGSYTITTGYAGIGLYTQSGGTLTRVALTNSDAAIWTAASNSLGSKAFPTPYVAAAGIYYIAFMYSPSAVVTAPSIGTTTSASSNVGAFDFTNSNKYVGVINGQSSLPATTTGGSLLAITVPKAIFLY